MSLGRALPLVLALSAACAPQERPKAMPSVYAKRLFLNEPFALGASSAASCRVTQAKSTLAESAMPPHREARVRPDVRALEVTLRCENARGETLPSRDVLPSDSVVLFELAQGQTLAPRPDADKRTRDVLVFELPEDLDPELPAPRRFAADTGKSVLARERAVAKLSLRTSALALEISLRQRYQDGALDALVDALAEALASGADLARFARDAQAETALAQLSTIYREVLQRFQPARLELTRIEATTRDAITVALSLARPRSRASSFEVARFELTLVGAADGTLRVASFDNRAEARAALVCDGLQEELGRALRESRALKPEKSCNALGILLPAACNEVEPDLLARALAVGARCGAPFGITPREKEPLPGDFQLTLRRGRAESGLDKNPRYVVSLFHGGQVVFHGRHWVESQERSDGRTDPALLAGLYAHVRSLDFFARRGGTYDAEHCSPTEDLGDVLTVIAANKQRMVLNRAGCRGPFSEAQLTELRRHVELVAGTSAWTAQGLRLGDHDAEQWAIAE